MNTDSGNQHKVFTLRQNRCSHKTRTGVHFEPEWVFTLGQNMHYKELTGWNCPAEGGPHRIDLELALKQLDVDARLLVAKELGHTRFSITYAYLGS